LPAALEIALGVELFVVHVALEVRRRAAVVAEKLLDVEEFAGRGLVADGLAVFVGLAFFRDVVGQGFRRGRVHVRAACFGAPDGSVSWGGEADGRSLGYGGSGGYWDGDEGGGDGYGDCGAGDVFRRRGGGEAGVGGGGCCYEGGDVDC
jgi:hypothetical protein